jgi:putative transcriptional regulator
MSKTAFDKIKAGLDDALAYAEGRSAPAEFRAHIPPEIDVRAIRKRIGLSQQAFSARFGFTLARIRDWEQHRSRPDSAARAYLLVIDREPQAVERALSDQAA